MKKIIMLIACLAMVFAVQAAKTKKVTWVIDAGHGGRDIGCEGRRTREKDITLAVAKEVSKLVKNNIPGVRVVLTREKDKTLSLQQRCDVANARGAALFISIHVNSAKNQFARGTETFYARNVPLRGTQAGKSELLALLMQRQYLAHGRGISRGVKQRELYVCQHTSMPCVLTEIGFISNFNEEAYLNSKDGQKELAQAIYKALSEWHELTQKSNLAQRELRNLRFTYFDPVRKSSAAVAPLATAKLTQKKQETKAEKNADKKKDKAETAKETPAKTETTQNEPAKEDVAKTETAEKEQAKVEEKTDNAKTETAQAETPKKAEKAETAEADKQPEAAKGATGKPYFAIQLMNTATRVKEGDYRLKGYQNITHIPSGERFKIIYGHSQSYKEIKNELAQVRETFPEAFIVAFVGNKQISTSEALQLLK